MAIEKIKELLETVRDDSKAQDALNQLDKSADMEGIIRYYAEAAKRLGFELTEEEIREGFQALETERREKTAAVSNEIEELPDAEMKAVTGGALWLAEDAPDGHELWCFVFYHGFDYSWQNGLTCSWGHYCMTNHCGLEELDDYPRCAGAYFHCVNTDGLIESIYSSGEH